MTKAPSPIADLVETFHRNRDTYTAAPYNETQVRREFIDPFFAALGWDVDNTAGYAEAYKDVIHEDAIKIGGATKAPDYCFRIGGTRKFFVEAKKPSVNIKADAHPAYQVRRYAWSAKLPLSILTDFEEFAVYDCRIKPAKTDAPGKARVKYLKYTDYIERWDEIASIFSRDAILKGSFDKFAESNKKKRGTAEVDAAFLAEIEDWRLLLARNFALRNKALTARELNYAVQVTIDRIIFLRMCEDRRIEQYGRLQGLVNGPTIYARLFQLFREADQRYNSGLFHFEREKGRSEAPDDLTPGLTLDDKVLKDILKRLYYPDCPYEFSVLPADILGQVYEQFLGQVIVRAGRSVKIEPKPEVKKAGGVYYTPTYIVDYIVKHTVGKLLEGKTPTQVAKLRILDPACGSGSFLLGAYQSLLDYHVDWYRNNDPSKHARKKTPPIYQKADNDWRLTATAKKRILLNNIHGVDIDTQAVEVTKLSLLLKVLEGETAETIGQTLRLFHERALPDLANNIKCGNSLIGPDFYENQQLSLLDEEERYRINAFDWKTEFPEVFKRKNPGFDAVIGNPPYLKEANNKVVFGNLRKSATARYCIGKMDLWYAFACVAMDLTRANGLHSFIATNNWTTNAGAKLLRLKVNSESTMQSFVDFADFKVFCAASIQTMVYLLRKAPTTSPYTLQYLLLSPFAEGEDAVIRALEGNPTRKEIAFCRADLDPRLSSEPFTLNSLQFGKILQKMCECDVRYLADSEIGNGIDVLQDFVTSKHLLKLSGLGVKSGDGVFVLAPSEMKRIVKTDSDRRVMKPYYTTNQLSRYVAESRNAHWIAYADRLVRENISEYPGIQTHLKKFAPIMTSAFAPFGLHRPREERFFLGNSIFSVRKTKRPTFAYASFPCYVSRAFMIVKPAGWTESDYYLLGVLNSRLVYFWLYFRGKKQGNQLQVDKHPLMHVPIRTIDKSAKIQWAVHLKLENRVQQMLDLHKQLSAAKTPADKTAIGRQITATDNQIDRLVYKLYDLTDEEIRIVEEATPS